MRHAVRLEPLRLGTTIALSCRTPRGIPAGIPIGFDTVSILRAGRPSLRWVSWGSEGGALMALPPRRCFSSDPPPPSPTPPPPYILPPSTDSKSSAVQNMPPKSGPSPASGPTSTPGQSPVSSQRSSDSRSDPSGHSTSNSRPTWTASSGSLPGTGQPPQRDGHASSQASAKATSAASVESAESAESARPPSSKDQLKSQPSPASRLRSSLAALFAHGMDALQTQVLTASSTLNSLTGYTPIETIKSDNARLESRLNELQARVRAARTAYKTSNTRRATTQREVTALLARKDGWTPADLERFTALYRADHTIEGEVAAATEELAEVETEEQAVSARLTQGILRRYHEEQVWSDRIRRASTWGTWGLMGVNVLLFLGLQFVAEPWRRRRLVRGVVEEERGVLEEVRARLEDVGDVLARSEVRERQREEERLLSLAGASAAVAVAVTEGPESGPPVPAADTESAIETPVEVRHNPWDAWPGLGAPWEEWWEMMTQPDRWRPLVWDLYGDRPVRLRMRDASLLALEGAAAGAMFMFLFTWR